MYIFIAAITATLVGLLKYTPERGVESNRYRNCTGAVYPSIRGFPFGMRMSEFIDPPGSESSCFLKEARVFPLIFNQVTTVALNFAFYFVLFSAAYFAYSKLSKKAKKK